MKTGYTHSLETRRKISLSKFGKKRSPETIRKMSESLKGRIAWNKGKTGFRHSQEVKDKISKTLAGTKRPKEVCEKISKALSGKPHPWKMGEKNHNWKGGISSENVKIRGSIEYRIWRKSVFERDNYKCILGGKEHGNKLNADHIKSFSMYPELRFNLNNGRTLCVDCHKQTDSYGGKQMKIDGLLTINI